MSDPKTRSTESDYTGYALQILVNPGSSRAFWHFDPEFCGVRRSIDAALFDRDEALDYGYHDDHLRVVGLTVVAPPGGDR